MSDRRGLLAGRLGTLGLLIVLGLAIAVPEDALPLAVENPDRRALSDYRAVLDALPSEPMVVIGFDPDLATYGEIRATVRAALADLLDRGALLAVISYTPEGRALAGAEMARLARLGSGARLLDLGFVTGAEAGVVRTVREVTPRTGGPIADRIAAGGGGLGAFDAALAVGGMDFGPRAWVEQVLPRVDLPLLAIAPTFLWPELAPYRATGQLDALLGTLRDGATLVDSVAAGSGTTRGPAPLALLLGMLAALAVFVGAAAGSLAPRPGGSPGPEETP